jgi:Predicted 3''-5'' exonuclease related to the exonuclease domain of PolB.
MRFRVVDIETVPDLTVWTPGETRWKLVPGNHCENPLPWELTREFEARVVPDEPFPPPQAHRVVAIAYVDIAMDFDKSPRYRWTGGMSACQWVVDDNLVNANSIERSLLGAFSASMAEAGEQVDLVTWNGRGFDLPVLSMRSLKLGVPFGWYYSNRDMRYRFSENGHLDLMDYLGDYGSARNMKLDDAAHLIGLPGKADMTGASVRSVYESTFKEPATAPEKMSSVGRYCLQDAIQTALIFLRTRFHFGKIDREEYNRCLNTFAQSDFIRNAIDIKWEAIQL